MIFRTKSETARDRAVHRAHKAGGSAASAGEQAGESIKALAGSLVHSVSEAVGPRAEAASAVARERAHTASGVAKERSAVARERAALARDRAVSGLDHGIDSAVPRVQEGIAGVGPRIDSARDSLVEDLLPKLQELIGNVQTAKNDVLARQGGAVAVVTGAPKKRKRKGGVLLTLGLLTAVGAAITYYLSQQSEDEVTDPWAGTPERPIGGAPGVDSQVRAGDTGAAAAGTLAEGTAAGTAATEPVASGEVATGDQQVEMIDVDDVPGTDPDARQGFGTDFGTEGDKPRD